MVYRARWCGASWDGPATRRQKAVVLIPSSMVNVGLMGLEEVLVIIRPSCSTVASCPVVRTDWMAMVSGLAAVSAAVIAAAQAAPLRATAHFQCRQQARPGVRRTVAAAAMAGGMSMTR